MIALRSDGCRARSPHLRLGSRRRNAGSRRQNARSRRSCREPGSSARNRAAQVHHELTRENARRQEVPAAMLPGPGPHLMRGFATDPSVTKQQLKRGTVRRIAGYARPYRWDLTIFLLAAALDVVITVAIPVLLGLVIDRGILPKRADVVLGVAAAVAALALLDAFFTRAQTGSLVSRLNSDVIGAQQALTSVLVSTVSSTLQLILVLFTMLYFSWLVTVIALLLIPMFIIPARLVGRRLQRLTRESMQLDAAMGSTMTARRH